MKRQAWLAGLLVAFLWATPARANTGVIVRTTNLPGLQLLCALPLTPCSIVETIDGTLGQVVLITTPLTGTALQNLLSQLSVLLGVVDAEVDQVLNLVGGLNLVPSSLDPTLLLDRNPVPYPANSKSIVWNSYMNQSSAGIVEVQNAQSQFKVTGAGIVADIDTGVDPSHPALQGVLLQGYDFTRNQAGASELNDLNPSDFPTYPPPSCTSTTCPSPAKVNQSSVAILDQSSVAILDTNNQYAAFGHGTMVMGVIHLVAPTAQLLPLKAFKSDGTANLSDILRAIYYAVQQGNANVINMSFDLTTASTELKNALDYANQLGVTSVASAGNDGAQETVYPAALQNDVMGVASVGSTSATDTTRSSFSNFGTGIVWLAAPGEEIVTTYPFSTYAAGWGTSFSAPFVSGGAALLRGLSNAINESGSATALANAAPLTDATLGKGRLDLVPALQSLSSGSGTPDYTVSAAPTKQTITAGQTATLTVSAAPVNGFNQAVTWSCTGAPTGATCGVSPSTVTLDGTHTATAVVTLTTSARGMSTPFRWPQIVPKSPPWVMWLVCLAWIAVLLIAMRAQTPVGRFLPPNLRGGAEWHFPANASWRRWLLASTGLIAVLLCVYSCGGGYGGGGGPGSPTLYSITLSADSVTVGASVTGTVTLSGAAPSGGAVVALSSSGAAATVPANVTIAAGTTNATFTVNTNSVSSSTSVTITASYGGASMAATLTVAPATTTTLDSLTLNPTSVAAGTASTGMVTLSGAAPSGGAVVALSSSSAAATVPANVTIAAGTTNTTFTVNTNSVSSSTSVTITASYGGASKTATLTVAPASTTTLDSVTLNPTSVAAGTASTGIVTLSGAAPSGGAVVTLSSSAAAATVPANVTIAAGMTSATFTVNSNSVSSSTSATITASYGGATKTATLTVTPATSGGTPAGTYTLTITGTSGSLSHSSTVQVTVN